MIVALLIGLFTGSTATGTIATILVVLGIIIVGLINITEQQTTGYLVATAVLLLVGLSGSGLETLPLGSQLVAMLKNILLFVTPAAAIVALKTVITISKEK